MFRRTAAAAAFAVLLSAAPAAAQLPIPLPGATGTTTTPAPPPPPPPVVDATVAGDVVTSLDGDALHAGATSTTLGGSLGVAWGVAAPGARQLLAVPGSVVVVGGGITAFNADTGTRRWQAAGNATHAAIVGDAVIASVDSDLVAYALADGAVRWTTKGVSFAGTVPVPAGDLVLVQDSAGGDNAIQAYAAATGALRWKVGTPNPGTPAVVGERVYAPTCGGGYLLLDRASGAVSAQKSGGCSGGISSFARAVGRVVQIDSEATLKTDDLTTIPTLGWRVARPGLALVGGTLVRALDPVGGAQRWSASLKLGGGGLALSGDTVVSVGAQGVELLEAAGGKPTWSGRFVTPSNNDAPVSITALGTVFVSLGSRLIALRPGAPGAAPTLKGSIKATQFVPWGTRVSVGGSATDTDIATAHAARLVTRASGRKARTSTAATTGADGTFSFKLRPSRYTRYQLTLDGRSNEKRFQVVVLTNEKTRISRSGADRNTITSRVTIKVPTTVPLRGRTYAIYIARAGKKRYVLLGKARIRGAGKGRGRATVVFRAPRFGKKDFIRTCVQGASARGLNYDDRLDRRCGTASARF